MTPTPLRLPLPSLGKRTAGPEPTGGRAGTRSAQSAFRLQSLYLVDRGGLILVIGDRAACRDAAVEARL